MYPRASEKDVVARRGLYCLHDDLRDKITDLQLEPDFADRPLSAPIVSKDGYRCLTQFARWDTQFFECQSRDEVKCRTWVDLDSVYWHPFDVPYEVQGSVVLCLTKQEVFLIDGDGSTYGFLDREAFSARSSSFFLFSL